ncbi:hypothetical protein V8F20_007733 [Naviculisporaceae sp. PSN 640]
MTGTIPDNFSIQLYNPDQTVAVKMGQTNWTRTDSWEFELPIQTFKLPSKSELDRDPGRGSPADLIPRIMFRWKKDGKLSRDMTCYMCGRNLGGRKNKEPDITIAFFKASKDSTVTIYEPNLHRVEVEDRKGLELVLLFSAEVIKELYLNPKPDVFNVSSGSGVVGPTTAGAVGNAGKRKNSRPSGGGGGGGTPPVAGATVMSGANTSSSPAAHSASAIPNSSSSGSGSAAPRPNHTPPGPSSAEIEAETRRLQAMVEREEREREKRERAEQKRIKKMLEEEEKEARKREAEIAKETERLRKKYGIEGQALPAHAGAPGGGGVHSPPAPALPPRTNQNQMPPQFAPPPPPPPPPHWGQGQQHLAAPALPPRPLSAGPGGPGGGGGRPFGSGILNNLLHGHVPLVGNIIGGGGSGGGNPPPPPHMNPPPGQRPSGSGRHNGGGGRRRSDEERRRVQRKRSMGW